MARKKRPAFTLRKASCVEVKVHPPSLSSFSLSPLFSLFRPSSFLSLSFLLPFRFLKLKKKKKKKGISPTTVGY